jgi:hypothetical protein
LISFVSSSDGISRGGPRALFGKIVVRSVRKVAGRDVGFRMRVRIVCDSNLERVSRQFVDRTNAVIRESFRGLGQAMR